MSIDQGDRLDEDYWRLEKDATGCITHLLTTIGQMKLEYNAHRKAVRELTSNVNYVLLAYREGKIGYETGAEILKLFAVGFADGVRAVETARRYRPERNAQRASVQQGSYRRNMTVNNQSFNVRLKARCATAECVMRGANFDLTDDAYIEYIEAAVKDKKEDVMAVVDHLAVVFPQARALQSVANVNTAYGLFIDGNINSAMTYAIGKGLGYNLKLFGVPQAIADRIENASGIVTGSFLK
jgi:hypothetical protein